MSEEHSSYRKIMKATSIFGGVQIFTIIISIIRSKFIAIFLGSAGMGIVGLLNSTIALIGGITNFGLSTSAVRDVSLANNSGNIQRVGIVVAVLRRWVWVTGAIGSLVVLFFSPWLSQITFGNSNYVLSYALVSITLLLNQLNVGQLIVLQGMRKIQYLAKASLSGSLLGLIVTLPLYYFLGIKGIVPALILASLVSLVISWYFASKVHIAKVELTKKLTFSEGKNMLKMGFLISLNGLFIAVSTYIIQIYISNIGGVAEVGLFTAGFAIINTYVGVIFTAMATDYYPRLSAVANSNELCKKTINQQAEISILLLGPIIIVFLIFIKLIIIFLYSSKFVGVEDMVLWLAIAIFFKATAWSIGFILLAKGDTRLFFWNDFTGSLYMLALDLIGYYFWGLTGLGVSFFTGYLIYFLQVFILCKIKYQFSFDSPFLKIFTVQFLLAITCFVIVKFVDKPYSYLVGSIFIFFSVWHSYFELDKRLGIKRVINDFLNTRLKKQQ